MRWQREILPTALLVVNGHVLLPKVTASALMLRPWILVLTPLLPLLIMHQGGNGTLLPRCFTNSYCVSFNLRVHNLVNSPFTQLFSVTPSELPIIKLWDAVPLSQAGFRTDLFSQTSASPHCLEWAAFSVPKSMTHPPVSCVMSSAPHMFRHIFTSLLNG